MDKSREDWDRSKYEVELNQLKYQLAREKQLYRELQVELRRVKASRSYRLGSLIIKLARLILFPLRIARNLVRRVREARHLARSQEFRARLESQARQMPLSNGSRFYRKIPLRLAIVTDEYMYNYYKDAFEKVYWLTPANWRKAFEEGVDLFLYVSCWRGGRNDEWRGHMRAPSLVAELDAILDRCRQDSCPALFQSIEDPSNFGHFLPLAQKFRYIYTSDAEMVPHYEAACPDAVVRYAEYGVNPHLNNPIGMTRISEESAFFAGSYPRRYEQRCRDMMVLFDSLVSSDIPLVIADRNSEYDLPEYRFPAKYQRSVIRAFPHDVLQSVHKLFAFNINLNSIKHSPTMCAMRVYELQAQGTYLFSNYARSVANAFPGIDIISYPKKLSIYLDYLRSFEALEARIRRVRDMLSYRTTHQQVEKMLSVVEGVEVALAKPRVLVVSDKLEAQEGLEGVKGEIDVDYIRFGDFSVERLGQYDYVAFFSDQFVYEPYYLQDMLNAFKFVDVPFVTRRAYFENGEYVEGPQHEYWSGLPNPFLTVYSAADPNLIMRLAVDKEEIGTGYSVDCFGVNCDDFFARQSRNREKEKALSVVVPVYNNGRFLLERCFPSLLRQRCFPELEVILVDDASTDEETRSILEMLARRYRNVLVKRLPSPASGSASRPRNVGVEIATCEYVTFLDPDNAISPEGYDALLEKVRSDRGLDAAIGFQIKITNDRVGVIGRLFERPEVVVRDPRNEVVLGRNFPAISTQASIIRRRLLIDQNVRYVERAVGQDTLFGYEVLLVSGKVLFTHAAYLEYFAERSDSVTNLVGRDYFERSLLMEKELKRLLTLRGAWGAYAENRADSFVNGWYMKKLAEVPESEYEACARLVEEIAKVNGVNLNFDEAAG